MAIQIPKGDNLGWAMPQARRTVIQGGDDPAGRAMMGVGREMGGLAIKLNREQQQQKESQDRVNMANGMLEHEKQVNGLLKTANDKMNAGELQPDQVASFVQSGLEKLPTNDYMPQGMSADNQERWNLNIKTVNQSAFFKGQGIEEIGVKTNAVSSINQLINNAKETNLTPDQVLEMLRSEDVKKTASLGFGIKSQEQLDNLARGYTFEYLQNQTITASDNGDYKGLKQLREQANNKDFYKDVLQSDDRVRLAHSANVGIDRIESKWKADQVLAKQAANEQYNNLKDSLYWQMSKDGKRFDELDQKQLDLLKPSDYEYFKNYKTVKNDDLGILERAIYSINNKEEIDLSSDLYRRNLTTSTIEGLAKKRANLKSNQEKENELFGTVSLFNSRARANNIKQGTDDYVSLQNSTIQALDDRQKKEGRKLTQQEQLQVIDDQMVKGYIKNKWFSGTSLYKVDSKDRENFYIDKADNIPPTVKETLTNKFKARGITPSNEQLINAYNAYLQQGN